MTLLFYLIKEAAACAGNCYKSEYAMNLSLKNDCVRLKAKYCTQIHQFNCILVYNIDIKAKAYVTYN